MLANGLVKENHRGFAVDGGARIAMLFIRLELVTVIFQYISSVTTRVNYLPDLSLQLAVLYFR